MKVCPKCGAENAPDSWLCDCGYEFAEDEKITVKTSVPARKRTPGTIVILGLFFASCIMGSMLLRVFPSPPRSSYGAVFLLTLSLVFFFWFVFRLVEYVVHRIGAMLQSICPTGNISPLLFHLLCFLTSGILVCDLFVVVVGLDGLIPLGLSHQQVIDDLADRIPINKPNGPKTYAAVLKYVGINKLTDYDSKMLPFALRIAAQRAKKAKDMDLLCALFKSDIKGVRWVAAGAIANVPPTSQTLLLTADALNNSDREIQQGAMCLLDDFAHKLAFNHDQVPVCPGIAKFNEKPDYYVSLWRSWWQANKEEMLSRVKPKEDELSRATVEKALNLQK